MTFTYDDAQLMPESVGSGELCRERGYRKEGCLNGDFRAMSVAPGMAVCLSCISSSRDVVVHEERDPLDAYQLSFCLEGRFSWRAGEGGAEHVAEAGQAWLHYGSADRYASTFASGIPLKTVNVVLAPWRIGPVLERLPLLASIAADEAAGEAPQAFPVTPAMRRALARLWEHDGADPVEGLRMEGEALEAMALFFEQAASGRPVCPEGISADDYAALVAAHEWIERHYDQHLTIAFLARRACMNECKFKRAFKRCFGHTVHECVAACRMDAARRLIERDGCRVKDAAWKVGYANVSHFIEAFRKRFGVTPGKL